MTTDTAQGHLIAVDLDPASLRPSGTFIDAERSVAVHDLLLDNAFTPEGRTGGEYRLTLSVADSSLVFDIATAGGDPVARQAMPLAPFRGVVRDYFLIVEAWQGAHEVARPNLEAIDVGRRGLHNEGATLVRDALSGKVSVDFATARRLFTLICALHWKG